MESEPAAGGTGSDLGLDPRLTAPAVRPDTVDRPRLVARLRAVADVPVVVVCAPAGYGKTTLLAQWAAQDPRPCAWLSLGPADDDAVTLLTDIASALDRIETVGSDVFDALRAGSAAVVPLALPRLSRVLGTREAPFVLVLDDAHHVASAGAADTLRLLIDHLPPGSQLVLGSRAEPVFPMARLRVDRRLELIEADALEMTPSEGTALLRAAGIDLDRQESEAVVRQTEGWAAALYLASLALRVHPDGAAPPFTGRERSMADYFREEVLVHATPRQLEFLTRTSILGRLTAALCDAVLERTDSAAMLRELADANLFVTPLDRHGEWYRVHALFADSLGEELRRAEPEASPLLHRRAGDWYWEQGNRELAVWHAVQAGAVERAADLMWLATPSLVSGGLAGTYMRWLEWFDRDQVRDHPVLALSAAWCELEFGAGDRGRDWLAIAASAPAGVVLADGCPLEAQVQLARAGLHQDGVRALGQYGQRARDLLPDDHPWRCLATLFTGVSAHLTGDAETAWRDLRESERRSSAFAPSVHVLALGQMAILAADEGTWDKAASLIGRARTHQREFGLDDYASGAHVAAAAALIAAHGGNQPVARASARRAASILATHQRFAPWAAGLSRVLLARTHLLLGDVAAARTLLPETERELASVPDASVLRTALDDVRRQVEAAGIAVPGGASSLTTAEVRVLQYLPTHMSFREIGERLFISRNTVKTHALSVYRKLGVSSRSEAVDRAKALGVIEPAGPATRAAAGWPSEDGG